MNRLSTLLWMLVIVVAAFMLYMVKYQVQTLHAQVEATARELNTEREAVHVASAEWAYLNRPERLAELSAKYLASSSVTADQVAEVEAVPFPSTTQASLDPEEGIKPAPVSYQKSAGGMR